jgi:hypothetical protein
MSRSRLRANLTLASWIVALGMLLAASEGTALLYQFKVNCLRNDTPFAVKVSNQWGSEAWKHRTLAPGKTYTFWYKNRSSPDVPTLKISFDNDPGPAQSSQTINIWTFYSNSKTCHKGPTAMLTVTNSGKVDLEMPRNKY